MTKISNWWRKWQNDENFELKSTRKKVFVLSNSIFSIAKGNWIIHFRWNELFYDLFIAWEHSSVLVGLGKLALARLSTDHFWASRPLSSLVQPEQIVNILYLFQHNFCETFIIFNPFRGFHSCLFSEYTFFGQIECKTNCLFFCIFWCWYLGKKQFSYCNNGAGKLLEPISRHSIRLLRQDEKIVWHRCYHCR